MTNCDLFAIMFKHHKCGEMSERFKELVLKTSDSKEPRVRISVSPPIFFYIRKIFRLWRSTQAGRRGAPAKGVGRVTVARVQIPPSPPVKRANLFGLLFLLLNKELNPRDGVAWGTSTTASCGREKESEEWQKHSEFKRQSRMN